MRLIRSDQVAPVVLGIALLVALAVVLVAAMHRPVPVDRDVSKPPTTVPPTSTTAPPTPPSSTVPTPPPTATPPPVQASAGAIRPLPAPVGCTVTAEGASAVTKAVGEARPGSVICVKGDLGKTELKLSTDGTEQAPIKVLGDGNASLSGLDVTGDWTVVSGLNIRGITSAPGIWVRGNHITIENVTVDSPRGGDGDGVRFFGSFLRFKNNTIAHTDNDEGHADCFQSYSTEEKAPETHDVTIEWNRCEDIANIGVIAEGPHSSYGDGSEKGNTYNLLIRNNYFQANSAQAIWLDDVQNAHILNNVFDGGVHHAVGMTNKSTGARIEGNEFIDIECQVGMDSSSKAGYVGPKSECGP